MELGLRNQIVLVAGSSRGIGKAIAKGFLNEGANVFITGRNKESLIKTQNEFSQEFDKKRILSMEGDLNLDATINQCKQLLLDEWDHLDHLVINMGTGKSSGDILSDPKQWENIFDQNFNGPYKLVRAFLGHLQSRKIGTITFIASIAGQEAINAPIDYSCSKAALIALAKNLSRKVAKDGIRVNTVAPGNVLFPGGTWEAKVQSDPIKINSFLEQSVPMKRFGTVEEIVAPVLFLSSKQASFITGAMLTVDGGQTCSFQE